MKSKLTLTKRRKLVLATVVICAVLIAGLGILWQSGKVSEAAVLNAHPGMVGWWRFDEGTGTVAGDSSGNGNNGTITGASWVAGKFGEALSFSSGEVAVPSSPSIALTADGTIIFWFKCNAFGGGWQGLIDKRSGAGGVEYFVGIYGGLNKLYFTWQGDSLWSNKVFGTGDVGQWFSIALVKNSTANTLYIYVNGVLDNSASSSQSCSGGSTSLLIGNSVGNEYFNGTMDEVSIYNRALSAAEIQAYYQQSPDFSLNLLAKVPKGTTDFIATLSWQGTGGINVTIQSPSQNYTEDMAGVAVYQKTTYSASSATMLNIKRLEVSIGALASDQNWYIILQTSNVQDYKMTVEVQK